MGFREKCSDVLGKLLGMYRPEGAVKAEISLVTEYNDCTYDVHGATVMYFDSKGKALAPEPYDRYVETGQHDIKQSVVSMYGGYEDGVPHEVAEAPIIFVWDNE